MTRVSLLNHNYDDIQVYGNSEKLVPNDISTVPVFSSDVLLFADTGRIIVKKINGFSHLLNDNGVNILVQFFNSSLDDYVTHAHGNEYTKFKEDKNILSEAVLWKNEPREAVVLESNNTTLQYVKELNGAVESCGELQLPPLEECESTENENFGGTISYVKELNGAVEFCGELQLPPLD